MIYWHIGYIFTLGGVYTPSAFTLLCFICTDSVLYEVILHLCLLGLLAVCTLFVRNPCTASPT